MGVDLSAGVMRAALFSIALICGIWKAHSHNCILLQSENHLTMAVWYRSVLIAATSAYIKGRLFLRISPWTSN